MNAAQTGNLREYTVSELSGAVKRALEDGFGYVRVRGELGRVTRAGSGHVYLDLKDDRAVLSGVMWKGVAGRLAIRPEQGMEVIAAGKISAFPGQSRYQIIIDSLEPAGVGALMALLEERKKKLAAEGLFDDGRKRAPPFLPETVGVVTSPSGAVIRDILHRLRDRFPRHVIVWPTLVQGKGAAETIAAAIRGFNALPHDGDVPRPDVLIVARGGGSLEDLWCFNEEIVVRAAAASEIPLISAVGHETDTTLIDYAADRRAPTPTAAAEMAVPVRSELLAETLNKARRLESALSRGVETARSGLVAAARGLGRPEDLLGPGAQRLDRAGDRLAGALRASSADAAARLAHSGARLGPQILRPLAVRREEAVRNAGARLARALSVELDRARQRVSAQRLSASAVARQGAEAARALEALDARARRAGADDLARRGQRLASLSQLLETLSHRNVLKRGFALVRAEKGDVISAAADVREGARLRLTFADGDVAAVAGAVDKDADRKDGGEAPPSDGGDSASRPARRKPAAKPVQKSLFD